MDKDKILDYVTNTPANTNPNVLKTMLNSGGSGGGGGGETPQLTLNIEDGVVTGFSVDFPITAVIPDGVTSIGDYAFEGCTSLTEINCGFAEGAVSGSPWGAPNATINYNV